MSGYASMNTASACLSTCLLRVAILQVLKKKLFPLLAPPCVYYDDSFMESSNVGLKGFVKLNKQIIAFFNSTAIFIIILFNSIMYCFCPVILLAS